MKILNKLSTFIFLFLLLAVVSCKKELPQPEKEVINVTILTGKTWIYYEYFENFSHPTALLVYKLERPNNTLDLSGYTIRFKNDKTYEASKGGQVVTAGTWLQKNSAEIIVRDNAGIEIFTIITVNEGFWVFSNKTLDTYGTMLAAP